MDDFPLLLVFFIFYLIAGSSGKKKKSRRHKESERLGPMRTRAQGERFDPKAMRRDQQTLEGFETAFEQVTEHPSCESERIHLHEVSQRDMLSASEGEDPCHGGNSAIQSSFDSLMEENETPNALREDVLRGVVMSEILMRPHERRALQRSRREYHG